MPAKDIPEEFLDRRMEGAKEHRRTVDVPTLMYVVYISFFVVLLAAAGMLFGFNQVTIAFTGFIILIILMIDFTSRIISD